jgi:hypothetical protein
MSRTHCGYGFKWLNLLPSIKVWESLGSGTGLWTVNTLRELQVEADAVLWNGTVCDICDYVD